MVRATYSVLAVLLALTLTSIAAAQVITESPVFPGAPYYSSLPPTAAESFPAPQASPAYAPSPLAAPDHSLDMGYPIDGGGPHWVATADAIFLQRSAPNSRQLLYDPGTASELLDASNLGFSMNAGPRVSLRRDDPAGLGLELAYFSVDGWRSSANFPSSAFLYGVGYLSIDDAMTTPVTDAQFQYTSRLYSGEVNLRYSLNPWLTPLVGLRWVDFEDQYAANGQTLSGPFNEMVRGHNHLYGSQLGLDARLFDRPTPFQLGVLAKAGLYANAASQNNDYADTLNSFSARASDSHLAFQGEIGVTVSYEVVKHFTLHAGYQVMWLTGVALAPNQIAATDFGSAQASVNTTGTLFCHGASAGLEVAW